MGKFTLGTYTKPEKHNEWVEDVQELADATAQNPETSATFELDIRDESKTILAIRDAAKTLNKTVKIVRRDDRAVTQIGTKDNGKKVFQGNVVVEIQLVERYKDGRGRKPGNGNSKPAEAEAAPVEAPAKGK